MSHSIPLHLHYCALSFERSRDPPNSKPIITNALNSKQIPTLLSLGTLLGHDLTAGLVVDQLEIPD